MPFMVGVREGVQEVIKSGDTAAVFWRARKFSIDADWILGIGIGWKLLLQDDGVLPAIAEIISIDDLGASPSARHRRGAQYVRFLPEAFS